ncbi:hypothetical protein V7149_01925 [Bacillus sp. JJ1503]|uniref:hypothetical protein n=1 Tax=Bacillus sp. JJ1503 TaxID=3122956 RepID=UPI002FFF9A3F
MSRMLEEHEIVDVITSPYTDKAIVIIGEENTLLHFYAAETDPENEENLKITQHLQSFQFFTKQQADDFAENITTMSALELIVATGKAIYTFKEAPTH